MGSREQTGLRGRSSNELNRGRTASASREFDLNRGRNAAVRNRSAYQRTAGNSAVRNRENSSVFAKSRANSVAGTRVNPNARETRNFNSRPVAQNGANPGARPQGASTTQNSNTRPSGQVAAPSNAAKNFKIKRRSRPQGTANNTRPSNNSGTQKSFKAENASQRSFNRPSFQSTRPMSTPRNYSRPSGRGSGGRGGRG